ncbi:hypothetical protein VNO77_20124 [Canavalia gladiata]|uniref:Hexosyltransferase n=1 Tax=Canavalia gladiata TaxID=3824 RepID=A0AAN9QL16_CANGL
MVEAREVWGSYSLGETSFSFFLSPQRHFLFLEKLTIIFGSLTHIISGYFKGRCMGINEIDGEPSKHVDTLTWTLCCDVLLFFIYVLTKSTTNIDSPQNFSKITFRHERFIEGVNVIEDMLSPDSVARQINDQISLEKAFVIVLSNATTMPVPLTIKESEHAIREMALLLYQMKLKDNNLYHFSVFSNNILATLVAINSTAINSKSPDEVVFHAAIKECFKTQIQNYYFKGNSSDGKTPIKFRNPKYLSMLNQLRFCIPEVLPELKKVAFLNDDIVVQKDLSDSFLFDLMAMFS